MASSSRSGHAISITYEIDSSVILIPDADDVLFMDDGRSISNATSKQKITTVTSVPAGKRNKKIWLQRVSLSKYNIYANTTDTSDDTTFDLNANISLSRERFEEYTTSLGASSDTNLNLNVHWINFIDASARYNRSLTNHTDINVAKGHSHEAVSISSIMTNDNYDTDKCYKAEVRAVNGSIVVNGHETNEHSLTFDYDCHMPLGMLFCGQELCGLTEFESRIWASATKTAHSTARESRHHHRVVWRILLLCVALITTVACMYWKVRPRERLWKWLMNSIFISRRDRSESAVEQTSPLLNVVFLSDEGDAGGGNLTG